VRVRLSTKDYIQSIYQDYLDLANQQFASLKAEKEKDGKTTK